MLGRVELSLSNVLIPECTNGALYDGMYCDACLVEEDLPMLLSLLKPNGRMVVIIHEVPDGCCHVVMCDAARARCMCACVCTAMRAWWRGTAASWSSHTGAGVLSLGHEGPSAGGDLL